MSSLCSRQDPSPVRSANIRLNRYRGRVASKRPPRSAGTTVLSDILRRPPRYSIFPPGPQESPADVRALQAGDVRRVACFLRAAAGEGVKPGALVSPTPSLLS